MELFGIMKDNKFVKFEKILMNNSKSVGLIGKKAINLYICLFIISFISCNNQSAKHEEKQKTQEITSTYDFNSDSAYSYVEKQVDFGARVPNTKSHEKCAVYLIDKIKKYADNVIIQEANLKAFDGTILKSKNIIAEFNPQAKTRILLCSHWDSRPWADQEKDEAKKKMPVPAANDGASGVGVLMEVARLLNINKPAVGVDIIFLDSEDYGQSEHNAGKEAEDSWCLGTQYWAKNLHHPDYTAKFGILLDMVGAPNATFAMEGTSVYYANDVLEKVWSIANKSGYSEYFIYKKSGSITDDHYYINTLAKIPSIDIIQNDPTTRSGFGYYWHTTDDTMKNIDRNTLKAVGQTLLNVISEGESL
ncbi:MAG: M28 family peptidase [Bacteroidota bacterium]|nr:M28 family peptidase [Bacteroidota bacterium]